MGPDADPLMACIKGEEVCVISEPGKCGVAIAEGTCQMRTMVGAPCPWIYRPVCGCGNQTYATGCEAEFLGNLVMHEGECARDFEEPETPPPRLPVGSP